MASKKKAAPKKRPAVFLLSTDKPRYSAQAVEGRVYRDIEGGITREVEDGPADEVFYVYELVAIMSREVVTYEDMSATEWPPEVV